MKNNIKIDEKSVYSLDGFFERFAKKGDKYKQKLERLEARRTDKQYTKEEADYVDNWSTQESQCEFCGYWRKDSCIKVIGEIRSEGHCKFWEQPEVEKSEKDTLQKAYLMGLIPDDLIEKAWKKQPIGTVTTRKDGQQYRKVAETGDMDQDWKLVSKDKAESGKPESEGNKESKEVKGGDKPIDSKELEIHAKNASESTLQTAIKESADEQVRISAHNELDRREKEEKPQEEKDGAKSEEKKDLSKEDAIKIDDHLGLKFLRKEFHEDTLKDPNFKREQEILNSLASELGLDNALEVYDAVKRYSSSTYGRMNNSLRENKLPKNTDLIDTFIDVAPKNSSSTLFRGIGADFGKTLTEGKVFSDPAFVSTTENKSVADNFAKKNKSGYTLEITGAQNLGTNMPENWRSARKEGEQEVLLPRNLQFKVDSIDGKKIKVSIVNEKEKEEKPIKKSYEHYL